MTREQHALITAAEECVELAQRLIKAARFGILQIQPLSHDEGTTDSSTNPEGLTNSERIYREFWQMRAMLGVAGIDAWRSDDLSRTFEREKVRKFNKYLDFSREYGTLQE